MRLLFLTDSFRPSRSACANRACVLVDAMRNAGVNVQVLASSDSLLGAPEGFTVTVRNLKVSAGAGFIVALTGDIMTMPGLPKVPAAEKIDVDKDGKITGLF